jgi:hypothetical protein
MAVCLGAIAASDHCRGALIIVSANSAVGQVPDSTGVVSTRVLRDAHLTWFGERAYTLSRGPQTWVFGTALQRDHSATDVLDVDHSYTTPGLFAQNTIELAP